MTAKETLKLISKQWCSINDIMLLGHIGKNSAFKVKKEIVNNLCKQGYKIPSHLVPMKEVVKYLQIDIEYLESMLKYEEV